MKIFIYESADPKKYAANFFADAFFKYTGKDFSPEQYEKLPRESSGKPKPIENTHFSISHSDKYWGIALSNKPVGLDLQSKTNHGKPRDFSMRALQKILAPEEKIIDQNPLNNFVAKEAYSKLTGKGLSIGFSKLNANELIKKYHHYHLDDENIILYAFVKP
ncbi:hypothetical protein IKF94_03240 [Candidatus Saccharibacteria bacterium]|nr:hypothetical protein [Candidatus Saccharibacteria bacterium]